MGYRFTPNFVNFVIKMSDPVAKFRVSADQFVVICVQVQRFTGTKCSHISFIDVQTNISLIFTASFKAQDREMKGIISISYEDYLSVALGCSIGC